MKVRDVMTSAHIATAKPGDDLALAAQMMSWANARHLPVVRGNEVVGVVSDRDLLRHRRSGATAAEVSVEAIMRSPAVTIDADAPLATAVSLMLERKLGCLPVLAKGSLVGIVTTTDLLCHDLETALERPAERLPDSVRAFMKPLPAVVAPTSELFDAAALMGARGIRHLPVVDARRRIVGLLSDRDVRAALGDPKRFLDDPNARERLRDISVASVMSRPVITVGVDAPITNAIQHLLEDKIGALPVVEDGGKVLGMLSYLDVIQTLRGRL